MSKETRKYSANKQKKFKDFKFPKSTQQNDDQLKSERPQSLESMIIDIQRRQNQFENEHISINEQDQILSAIGQEQENSRKTFYREFKKVVDASDIIIQVLDARDPLGCRCSQVEEAVLTSGKNKKLILLLNKIDLIPRDNLDKWLKYLRNEFPTIAFRSSTQNQRDRLGHIKTTLKACDEHLLKTSNKCFGASTLMNLLSNYCRKNDIKTSITVGVVGFPNVGKSSVINSLKRSQACETGSTPGITKQMQTIKLDKLIKLLDCPGIVMSKETNPTSLILRNCVRIETIENPIPAVELLLNRCTKEQMMRQYNLNNFEDVNDFLFKIAFKIGCLNKGGIPDIHKAAQRILFDWTNGKLTYFTEPPERSNEILSTELVTQMKDEFDIEALLNNEDEQLNDLENNSFSPEITHSESISIENDFEMNDDHQLNKKDFNEVHFIVQTTDKSKHSSIQQIHDKQYDDEIRRSIPRSNHIRQQEFKKMKKNQKKTEKTIECLSNELNSMIRLTSTSNADNSGDE